MARHVLLKIGSKLLTTEDGQLDLNNMRSIVNQVVEAMDSKDTHFLIVSSGSVTCGSEQLDMVPQSIPDKQAAASVGQWMLMREYSLFFGHHGYQVGQVLLTKDGLGDATRQENTLNTLTTLLKNKAVPIINENDTVATDEIRFGDNDTLSSLVACLMKVDLMIILSDIDGLHTANPKLTPNAPLIEEIESVTDEIIALVDESPTHDSSGGMKSKLIAAKMAAESGIDVVLANGRRATVISEILAGKSVGTRVLKQT